eukprot:7386643-Alexandrium_andersonii.AAC.1
MPGSGGAPACARAAMAGWSIHLPFLGVVGGSSPVGPAGVAPSDGVTVLWAGDGVLGLANNFAGGGCKGGAGVRRTFGRAWGGRLPACSPSDSSQAGDSSGASRSEASSDGTLGSRTKTFRAGGGS